MQYIYKYIYYQKLREKEGEINFFVKKNYSYNEKENAKFILKG